MGTHVRTLSDSGVDNMTRKTQTEERLLTEARSRGACLPSHIRICELLLSKRWKNHTPLWPGVWVAEAQRPGGGREQGTPGRSWSSMSCGSDSASVGSVHGSVVGTERKGNQDVSKQF